MVQRAIYRGDPPRRPTAATVLKEMVIPIPRAAAAVTVPGLRVHGDRVSIEDARVTGHAQNKEEG